MIPDTLAPWAALADRLLDLGAEIAGAAGPEILRNDDGAGDIRLMTASLIARSLSNMRSVLTLMYEQRIIEARVLTRCILENQYWATGFAEDPDRFRKALIDQDLNKKGSSGEMLFTGGGLSTHPSWSAAFRGRSASENRR